MNRSFRVAVLASLACVVAAVAQPPATKIVVLDNDRLLEGEVSRLAEGVQIRQFVGGDVIIPANRVSAIVESREKAFGIIAARSNLRDADERLRLARWCLANNLPNEAHEQAKKAAAMRPGFVEAEKLAKSIITLPAPAPVIKQAKAEELAKPDVMDVSAIDYNTEAFPVFASKVNSLLLNACASCHSRDDVTAFKLSRTSGRAGAIRNLQTALAAINPNDPTTSPILVKSLSAHGGALEPALKSKNHPAYVTLETWVKTARAGEATFVSKAPTSTVGEPKKLPDTLDAKAKETDPVTKPTSPKTDDEFDPAGFNSQRKPKG